MARVTPITARFVDQLLDLQERFSRLTSQDARLRSEYVEVAVLISAAIAQAERIDRTRRIARNIEDSGELTPWAIRNAREMENDLNAILHIDDYRHADSIA